MSDVKSRIKEFIDYIGVTKKEFETACGLSTGYTTSMRKSFGPQKLNNVLKAYPQLNREWLLYGEGDMLNTTVSTDTPILHSVKVIPLSAHGGTLVGLDTESITDTQCETIASPIAGAEMAISVTGESMEPTYPRGSRVLIKSVNHESFIEWGEVYVLDTVNGILLKEVQPAETNEKITCVSLNPNGKHKPFDVPLKDIRKMYKVLACLTII